MLQTDDIRIHDQITASIGEPMTVARDIRVADLRFGIRGFDAIPTSNSTRPAGNRSDVDRSAPKHERTGVVITRLEFPNDAEQREETTVPKLEEIHWVGEVIADRLRSNGFDTVGTVAAANLNELTQVAGIGETRAREIRRSAQHLLGTG